MKQFYSPKTFGFYDDLHPNIPEDKIEISEQLYNSLMSEISIGKIIEFVDGLPVAAYAPVSTEILVQTERLWRDSELDYADKELLKVQDSAKSAKGTVANWREYRNNLREWPEHEKFPDKEYRPTFKE